MLRSSSHHPKEPLLVGTRVETVKPLDRALGSCSRNPVVVLLAGHQPKNGLLPKVDVLLRNDIVTIFMLGASDNVHRETVRQVDLGFLETASIGSDDGDATKLGLSHDNSPRLEPDRRCKQDLDAVPNLISVAGGGHDP